MVLQQLRFARVLLVAELAIVRLCCHAAHLGTDMMIDVLFKEYSYRV